MPRCQKEKHNQANIPKEERCLAKPASSPAKKQLKEAQLAAKVKAKAALHVGNATNIMTPVDRFGEYEVGCETEEEYKQFNVKKENDSRRAEQEGRQRNNDNSEEETSVNFKFD